ncbi:MULTISPECIES: hypothetical protein [unclassified Spirosoma]|uniref:hypothetical protein n=1 Tax=unclassified Spirosoma TaxID=2621999 RepID=UPI00095E9871|nr:MULTISPECIES: hypothetical protein [unclassified Spirosoma]MBN8821927.1 hypothetical protein [Spirosoma sp.]OJW80595.1 MAG: hypothetical protein BGO59_34555 [Spirosoma sp. 48-14]
MPFHSVLRVALLLGYLTNSIVSPAQKATEIRRFQLKQVQQGVAVDQMHFYVINNHSLTKHTKVDGKQVAAWEDTTGLLKHLNSGVVIGQKLYCTHSNYPDVPMASSIEIFDTRTLKHVGNHSFGLFPGSMTWADFHNGYWWVAFANYSNKSMAEGRDNRWTTLVKFNENWQQLEAWAFPANVLQAFAPYSTSGGTWGPDGLIYCTGHDKPELYVLKLPERGHTLQYVKTIPTVSEGQAFAIDRSVKNKVILFGITRNDNYVVVSQMDGL